MRREPGVEGGEPRAAGGFSRLRRHPVITAVLLGCTLAGAVLGFYLLTGDWSAARRIAGGAVAGAGVGLLITAPKMLG
jgi:hypothetical protein